MIAEQARMNRVNMINPYGSQTFEEDPSGRWTSQTQFSPELQALFGRQTEMAGAAPSRYQSAGMGGKLRERIGRKLGRGTESSFTSPEYGNVGMPIQEEPPQQSVGGPSDQTNPMMSPQSPDIQSLMQALRSRGGGNRNPVRPGRNENPGGPSRSMY